MEVLEVVGGKRLCGELEIESAKNSLLPILAGSIINRKKVVINKFSKYSDVLCMLKILQDIGCVFEYDGENVIIDSSTVDIEEVGVRGIASCFDKVLVSKEKKKILIHAVFYCVCFYLAVGWQAVGQGK